jgi:hypothetical protein
MVHAALTNWINPLSSKEVHFVEMHWRILEI